MATGKGGALQGDERVGPWLALHCRELRALCCRCVVCILPPFVRTNIPGTRTYTLVGIGTGTGVVYPRR